KGADSAPTQVDSSWHSVTGGARAIVTHEATVGNDGERRFTPGKAYVTDLELSGPLRATPRQALAQWLEDTRRGKNVRRTVTITPIDQDGKAARTFVYADCLITLYRIPRLDASSAGPITETVVIRPGRLEIC
ncbi:MAG: phage tail protein, partial [Chloroflexota bacterium]